MGFNGGAGIHGTAESDSLGSAASHGCIRMDVGDVEDLWTRSPSAPRSISVNGAVAGRVGLDADFGRG